MRMADTRTPFASSEGTRGRGEIIELESLVEGRRGVSKSTAMSIEGEVCRLSSRSKDGIDRRPDRVRPESVGCVCVGADIGSISGKTVS